MQINKIKRLVAGLATAAIAAACAASGAFAADAPKPANPDASRDALPPAAPQAGLSSIFPSTGAGAPSAKLTDRQKVEAMLRESKTMERNLPRDPASRRAKRGAKKAPKRSAASEAGDASPEARGQAEHELLVPAAQTTPAIVDSPATVTAGLEPAVQPISYTALEVGLSLQPYQPSGQIALPLFASYDAAGLGTQPMAALELRWTPLEFNADVGPLGPVALGAFGHLGYAQHDVTLRGPTGYEVDHAKLHSFQALAGFDGSWRFARAERWSLVGQLGIGRFDMVQAGNSSYSSASASLPIGSTALFVQWRALLGWSAFVGYQRLWALRAEGDDIRVQRNNWLVGVLGSFQ